jgi:HEAT repeat protein
MRKFLGLLIMLLMACAISPQAKAKRIIEEGLEDASKTVRIEAARGIEAVDRARSADLLVEMLEDSEPEVQATVLDALIPYNTATSRLDAAVTRLCASSNPAVRVAAYRNVVVSADTVSKELLGRGLNDESARVREVAYSGLAKFGERDVLQKGFRDTDPLVRITVAKALSQMGSDGMVEYIRDELKKLPPDALGPGIIVLAQSGDTAAVSLMKALLRESTGELRVDVAEALLILNDHAGVGALEKAMQSQDPFVRIRTVRVLTRYDIPEMRARLDAATRDDYVNVAVQAVHALAEHDAKNYRKRFMELMDSQNALLRIAAAAAYLRN